MDLTEQFSLKDKVIVVTGGTGVLGEAFIQGVARAGAKVGILGRNKTIADERANFVNENGGEAMSLIADVTKKEELIEAREQVIHTWGKIDGLVNGAGGNLPGAVVQPGEDVFNLNFEALKEVMDLNLFGTLLPTQVFGETIQKNGRGSIVNISSMAPQRAITRVLGYSMAKAAIDIYTKWIAVELGKRYGDALRVNAIAPGFFLTQQNKTLLTTEDGSMTERGALIVQNTPFNRFGNAEELTGALIWLLSDASKFVTGTVINVDGGFSAFSGV